MTKVTNNAAGPRGVTLKDGSTRYLEPGETAELDYEGALYEGLTEGEGGISSMKKADLAAICDAEGIAYAESDSRADLIAKIEAARAA